MRQQSSLSLRSVTVLAAVLPVLPHAGSVLSAAVAVVLAAALVVVVAGLTYLAYALWRDWVPGGRTVHGPREAASSKSWPSLALAGSSLGPDRPAQKERMRR